MTERPATPPPSDILATWSPPEVDTVMSAIWVDIYKTQARVASQEGTIAQIDKRYNGNLEKALQWDIDRRARAVESLVSYEKALDALSAESDVYEAEYRRRPWSRYWLVDNANGHVHTSMSCSTCYPSTQYSWLIELSGQDETACVSLVGERACTVCMPSAPTRRGFGDNTSGWARKTQAEKDEAARVKAGKAAAKAAKAITDVDGSPLRVDGFTIATLAAAKIGLVDALYYPHQRQRGDHEHIAAAIAHKTGESVAEVMEAAQQRLKARNRRDGR